MIFLTHIFLPPLPTILFFELVLRQAKCQGRLVGFMPLLMQNLTAKVRKKMEVRKKMMELFENKIGGILNKIGGITNKILVLFDRSIRIPRAHARIHKVFYPCNRCHLATLSENQRVTCGNEVTRVTRNGDFPLIFTQHSNCVHQTTACGLRSPGLRGTKPRASRVAGAASKGRRCRLRGAKGLSLRVLGIIPIPPKGCLASPIGGIGVPP